MTIKPVHIVFLLLSFLFLAFVSGSFNHHHPEERLRECRRQCSIKAEQRPECYQKCQEEFRQQQHGSGGGGSNDDWEKSQEDIYGRGQETERTQKGQQSNNPYILEEHQFSTKLQSEHGRVRVLPKFNQISDLLKGIKNYRISILEAEPQTFVLPNHWDADAVFFVAQGKGSLTMILENKRESVNLKEGDVFRVPAGVTVYLTNRDNKQRLVLAKLLRPVSIPGEFETFFQAGPESFYEAFSRDLLAAALNTNRDQLQRIFGRQKQGVIVKGTPEQIQSMSKHQEGGIWPFSQSKGPFNLYEKRPTFSNQYGRLHEVDADDFSPLEDLNVRVAFANITQGSMAGPVYNSEATKISMVIDGEGEVQMACPHLSSSSEYQESQMSPRQARQGKRQGSPSYEKIRAPLKQGTVFIQPAGHPAAIVSSQSKNLLLVCFEINAKNNKRFPLAGKNNVMNQIERIAKELSFGVPAREIEEVFGKQEEEFFFKGPRQQRLEEFAIV